MNNSFQYLVNRSFLTFILSLYGMQNGVRYWTVGVKSYRQPLWRRGGCPRPWRAPVCDPEVAVLVDLVANVCVVQVGGGDRWR